jgi:hypothetical protein
MRPACSLGLFVGLAGVLGGAGVLTGVVSDPRGLVVRGAAVARICGAQRESVKTDSQGRFRLPLGPVGAGCALVVTYPGFSQFQTSLGPGTNDVAVQLSLAPLGQSVTVRASVEDPLLRSPLTSVSLSADELGKISNNTDDLIRYARQMAGDTGRDSVYVDGLPSSTLPPAETIARITVNADPFSAEYADGDLTHIDIFTKNGDRKLRYGFGGLSLGLGGSNPLNPALRSDPRSANGYISGGVPLLPLTFSIHGVLASDRNQQPIVAILPQTPGFVADQALRSVTVSTLNGSGSLDLWYSHAENLRVHFAFFESRNGSSNGGAGGLALPETGVTFAARSREVRATAIDNSAPVTYEGGLVIRQTNSNTRANSDELGVAVPGDFVAGGAAITDNNIVHTTWTVKNVFRSSSSSPSWSTGFTVSGSDYFGQEAPNTSGTIQFPNLQAYLDALASQGTGTLFFLRGNGTVRYRGVTAAPFVQKRLLHSARFLVNAGLRADYQSGIGTLISPRISGAARWRGFVLRTGAGVFVHNVPENVFVRTIENDGAHLQQFMETGASFAGGIATSVSPVQLVHSELSPQLTQPRVAMLKSSLERSLRSFLAGTEYTWSRGIHELGSQRFADPDGWLDLVESNRSSVRNRIHTRLTYKWRTQSITAHYEWIHSLDNTSGPFSFPAEQNNLGAEWARSAGVSPHNVSLAANLRLPAAIFLTLTDTWRSSAPYNITTGLGVCRR